MPLLFMNLKLHYVTLIICFGCASASFSAQINQGTNVHIQDTGHLVRNYGQINNGFFVFTTGGLPF